MAKFNNLAIPGGGGGGWTPCPPPLWIRPCKVSKNECPPFINELFHERIPNENLPTLRSLSEHSFVTPRPHKEFFKQSLANSGPIIWNSLPLSLKSLDSTHKFHSASTQCISERMQNRRLRNGQTFTGTRAFSRQKCFVQFFIQNCTLRMYCYIGLACPSTIFQNTIISGMEAL